MRPVSVFAKRPGSEIEQLRSELHGRWRQATRAVVLLSPHGLAPAQIAELLDCYPATARWWIGRFNDGGLAGLTDRPGSGRPAMGGRRLAGRIAALLERPGPLDPAADPPVPGLAAGQPRYRPARKVTPTWRSIPGWSCCTAPTES